MGRERVVPLPCLGFIWASSVLNWVIYLAAGGDLVNLIGACVVGVVAIGLTCAEVAEPPPPVHYGDPAPIRVQDGRGNEIRILMDNPCGAMVTGSAPVAEQRAFELLADSLTSEQLAEVVETGCFTVKGNYYGYKYRINAATGFACDFCVHTIQWDPGGRPSVDAIPAGDRALMFKLWIEGDEREFRNIAHRYPNFSPPIEPTRFVNEIPVGEEY
jgi:hypothetical protein